MKSIILALALLTVSPTASAWISEWVDGKVAKELECKPGDMATTLSLIKAADSITLTSTKTFHVVDTLRRSTKTAFKQCYFEIMQQRQASK